MSYLEVYRLPTEVKTLRIQALRHHPKRVHLHSLVWKAICCYLLCNCSLDPMVQLPIGPVGGGSEVVSLEGHVAKGFLLHRGGVGSLWTGKGSPLASDSEARAAVTAMYRCYCDDTQHFVLCFSARKSCWDW